MKNDPRPGQSPLLPPREGRGPSKASGFAGPFQSGREDTPAGLAAGLAAGRGAAITSRVFRYAPDAPGAADDSADRVAALPRASRDERDDGPRLFQVGRLPVRPL